MVESHTYPKVTMLRQAALAGPGGLVKSVSKLSKLPKSKFHFSKIHSSKVPFSKRLGLSDGLILYL